jgi:hypothetical protein
MLGIVPDLVNWQKAVEDTSKEILDHINKSWAFNEAVRTQSDIRRFF